MAEHVASLLREIENNPLSNTLKNIVEEYFGNQNAAEFFKVPFSMFSKEDIRSLLNEAGFKKIDIELVTKEGVALSASDAAKSLIFGTPAFKEISEADTSAPEKIVAIAEKEIAELYGDKTSKSELNAWVVESWK